MEFYKDFWHPYWTLIDLVITLFVLYQLRRLHFLLKDFDEKTKEK